MILFSNISLPSFVKPLHYGLLIFIIFLLSSLELYSEIRYVSKTGTSIPPYLNWENASDSIQKCIDISFSGDTIYVGNGVYKEVIEMIPGLALIGMDWDSTVIDVRGMLDTGYYAIKFKDNCYLRGFRIIIAQQGQFFGGGVVVPSSLTPVTGTIEQNTFNNGSTGISCAISNLLITKNVITGSRSGIDFYDMNHSYAKGNQIINAYRYGINIDVASSPVLVNNILKVTNDGIGISCFFNYQSHIWNNLIIGDNGDIGIESHYNDTIINNVIYGTFSSCGIFSYGDDYTINNSISAGSKGYVRFSGPPAIVRYNNFWGNDQNFAGYLPDSTNMSFDPMFEDPDSMNFYLQMFSPLIDAGDPDILDRDGSRSDIGLYGGPFGDSYAYKDLAPRAPKGLTVTADSNDVITIKWKKNTEADLDYYKLFRDTSAGFTADSTTLVGQFEDTSYIHIIPPGAERFYYKLTAVDKQSNESVLSEEIGINLVSVGGIPQMISDYYLFQNYPNPFNPSTLIPFRLKERSYVKLRIYNINGELVSTLVNGTKEAGYYEAEFWGQDTAPGADRFTSGIYLYKLDVMSEGNIPVYSEMKKMIYLK